MTATAKRVMQVVMNSSEASSRVCRSQTQSLVARRPCVRGRRSAAPLRMPSCILAWTCVFVVALIQWLFFFFFSLKQSLAASPSVFSSSLAVLGEKGKRKITSLAERRRQRRTAAWPWTSPPPTSQWQGRNIQYCLGESSHHTWTKVGQTENTIAHCPQASLKNHCNDLSGNASSLKLIHCVAKHSDEGCEDNRQQTATLPQSISTNQTKCYK